MKRKGSKEYKDLIQRYKAARTSMQTTEQNEVQYNTEIQDASTVIERLKNGEVVEQDILLKLTRRLVSALEAMKIINSSLRNTWQNTLNSISTRLTNEWGIIDVETQINQEV